jgi:hypothetical protein
VAYQNEYLRDGGDRVDVVVRVVASSGGTEVRLPSPDAEFVILLDCSGSMSDPYTKLSAARRGAMAAVMALHDGVAFAVVAGNERAMVVYPDKPRLVPATDESRVAAAAAIERVRASGGTAIGRWLALADDLFTKRDGVVRHALLLTDGKNELETAEELDLVLARCHGRFRCDCRATGEGGGAHGWSGAELLRIAQALSGSVQSVEDPSELPANLSQATAVVMDHAVADLRIRVRTAEGATVRSFKQVHPFINDLTAHGTAIDGHTHEYSTGSWGAQQRDYQLTLTVQPRPPGTELRVAWISIVSVEGQDQGDEIMEVPTWARWTRDPRESTRINPHVAHYAGQAELAAAIQDGMEAYKQHRFELAKERLGTAVALAVRLRHSEQLTRLARLVDIHDPQRGLVSLRPDIDPTGVESAVLDSVRTGGFHRDRADEPIVSAPVVGELCPICQSPAVYRYCEEDGYDFAGGPTASTGN